MVKVSSNCAHICFSDAEMQIRQSILTEVGCDGVNRSNEIAAINKGQICSNFRFHSSQVMSKCCASNYDTEIGQLRL